MWKLRPVVLLITLGLVVMAALVLVGLVVSGPIAQAIGDAVGLGDEASRSGTWPSGRSSWPSSSSWSRCSTTRPPTSSSRSSGWISVGAAVAIGIWVVASLGFGFYVSNFGKYNALYGSVGGIIVFLLWLWLTNLALLLGAEIDAELERARELQAGIRAEQTPPAAAARHQRRRQGRGEAGRAGRRGPPAAARGRSGRIADAENGYVEGREDGRHRTRHGATPDIPSWSRCPRSAPRRPGATARLTTSPDRGCAGTSQVSGGRGGLASDTYASAVRRADAR